MNHKNTLMTGLYRRFFPNRKYSCTGIQSLGKKNFDWDFFRIFGFDLAFVNVSIRYV